MPADLFFLEIITVCMAGLIFGSFASAVVYRIPREISILKNDNQKPARSACPHCGYELRFGDLIPLFSWIFLKGRCRHCKAAIPATYPLIELTTMAGFLAVYALAGFVWSALPLYLLVPAVVALLYIDLEHFILPDELNLICGVLGAVYLSISWQQNIYGLEAIIWAHILGGAVLYSVFAWVLGWMMQKLLKKEALGFGDVKFFAVAGLWLGASQLPLFLIGCGLMGIVFAVLWRLAGKGEVFPFGPAIILSFFTLLFFDGSHLF
ncbi:MAG: prepilin peptidase [Alphaproteobacteria bacterium]